MSVGNQQGRYLQGSELCQRYHLKPEPVPEADIERMQRLLWVWEQKYEADYAELEKKSNGQTFNIHDGDNLLGNLRHWEKFAEENYVQPSTFDKLSAGVSLVLAWWAVRVSVS